MRSQVLFLPLALVAAISLFVMLIKPGWNDYQSQKKKLAEIEEKTSNFKENKQKVEQGIREYNQLDQEKLSMINAAVPNDDRVSPLVNSLNQIIDRNKILFKGFSLESKIREDFSNKKSKKEKSESSLEMLDRTKLNFTVTGEYLDLRRFVYDIEKMNRFPVVKQLRFSATQKSDLVEMGLQFDVFKNQEENSELVLGSFPKGAVWGKVIAGGGNVDFVEDFYEKVNTASPFSPDLSGKGKEDLFQKAAGPESGNSQDDLNQSNAEEAENFQPEENSGGQQSNNEEGTDEAAAEPAS